MPEPGPGLSHDGRIDFEQALNPEQLAAVLAPDGPLLVLAAAGTGKTRTIVYRVAHLVQEGVRPDQILLLTFTNKAAREMLERAEALVGASVGDLWGGTFHHMANRILRRHAPILGYRQDYTILDRDDSVSLLRTALKDLGLQEKTFPRAEVLLGLFSWAANAESPVREVAETRFSRDAFDIDAIMRVHTRYEEAKRKLGAMDFDDLLVNGLKLFRDDPAVLARYQARFRYVLVDEYQDTNTIQAEWVDRVAQSCRNLLVVGDDFQSIYSWRGADYRNILTFRERYPDAQIYLLETNYRSTPEILSVANACITGNKGQFQKRLRSTREPHHRPVVVRLRDGDEQARYLAEEVRRLQREGYRLGEMAVLYRAHYHAMELQIELARSRLPHVITSGVRFFEQAHVKDVLSLLRLIQNPADELSFGRLLQMLPGVGPRTAAKVWDRAGGAFDPRQRASRQRVRDLLPAAAQEGWRGMCLAMEAAGEPGGDLPHPGELLAEFGTAFYDRYAAATFENARERAQELVALADFCGRYDSVEGLLSEVSLLSNLDAEGGELGGAPADALHLSTVHQAKGLEWKVVFILWASEGMFPAARALSEPGEGEAEERRLFYVAVTRARDELYLCVPEVRRSRDGGVVYCRPSRFVQELPRGLVREERPGFV